MAQIPAHQVESIPGRWAAQIDRFCEEEAAPLRDSARFTTAETRDVITVTAAFAFSRRLLRTIASHKDEDFTSRGSPMAAQNDFQNDPEVGRNDRPGSGWASSDLYRRGLDLLNQGRHFEAHEALEDVWREAPRADRQFLQGLIQVAVALHHHAGGNRQGARSVLRRAAANLAPYAGEFGGVQLDKLRAAVDAWRQALEDGGPEPPLVQVFRLRDGC